MSTNLSILGKGYWSFGQHLFRSVKSTHIHHLSFFFLSMTTFASHSGYCIGLMTSALSSLWTSAFAASVFRLTFSWAYAFSSLLLLLCLRSVVLAPGWHLEDLSLTRRKHRYSHARKVSALFFGERQIYTNVDTIVKRHFWQQRLLGILSWFCSAW